MKKIIIIAGPNGAGKTTFAREFLPAEAQTLRFINADLIAAGLAPFNPESASFKAGRLMLETIDECVEAGHSFAFETTLSGMVYLKQISLWQAQGYQVKLWFLSLPNEDIAVSRVARRVLQGGHNIPQDVICRRFKAGFENLYASYIKAVDSWAIYDSSGMQPRLIDWRKKTYDKDIRTSSDPDLAGSYPAMERAAFSAQDLAIKTNTGIVVAVDGKNLELTAADLIKLRHTEARPPNNLAGIYRSNSRLIFCTPCFCAGDKYMMHTYQASVRTKVNGRNQVIKTEIRAMNAQDARWLLWAQYGFHSIQAGPNLSRRDPLYWEAKGRGPELA